MSAPAATSSGPSAHDKMLFWGCFIALITTAFAFVGRLTLINVWAGEFGLDAAQAGRLGGIGVWPFAVSIIFFSLVIDKIGYKTAMLFAFAGHIVWAVMGVAAFYVEDKKLGYDLLYWGSLVCALANGTVEAFINPVVATMFNKEKTKWLNILHAGWPGGLVITGLFVIALKTFGTDVPWAVNVGVIAIPAVIYLFMLIGLKFPESERVSAGVSYREMLQEFGTMGALIVGVLFVLQMLDFFAGVGGAPLKFGVVGLGIAIVAGFGVYTKSLGRPFLLFMILIMMPLATTEIGTDGWITGIMEGFAKENGFSAEWILVYTSAIMLVLRFFAGPIVHAVSPLGLLTLSAVLAIAGLSYLGVAGGAMAIFIAATLYGFGKTFFWPTMLGVVSEQCPKGGALTLNAISGIGMLAVGTLGFPYIGTLKAKSEQQAIVANEDIQKAIPGLVKEEKVVPLEDKKIYEVIEYKAIDEGGLNKLLDSASENAELKVNADIKKTIDTKIEPKTEYQVKGDDGEMAAPKDDYGDVRSLVVNAVAIEAAGMDFTKDADGEELSKDDAAKAKKEFIKKREKEVFDGLKTGTLAEEDKNRMGRAISLKNQVTAVRENGSKGALKDMAMFPAFMLVCYIILIFYFKSKGGYSADVLTGHSAEDEKFTGGVEGAVE